MSYLQVAAFLEKPLPATVCSLERRLDSVVSKALDDVASIWAYMLKTSDWNFQEVS
jgi:hypothetical protein